MRLVASVYLTATGSDPSAFTDSGEALSGDRDLRGSVATDAGFRISEDWSFGWDLNLSSDATFNRDYRIPGATAQDLTSTIFLTGMNERNYFSTSGHYFSVQREDTEEDLPSGGNYVHDDQAEQAFIHPVIDHNYALDRSIFGGEVRFDSNLASLTRESSDRTARSRRSMRAENASIST